MKQSVLYLLLFILPLVAESADSLAVELKKEKAAYEARRNTLEEMTRKRWQIREVYLSLLANKKEEQQKQQRTVEQRYSSLTLRREENLTAGNRRDMLQNKRDALREESQYRKEVLLQQLEKSQLQARSHSFPINRERRLLALQNRIPITPEKKSERELLATVATLRLQRLYRGAEVKRSVGTILSGSNEPLEVQLIRFGSLFALAMEQSDSAPVFYLTQIGTEESPLFKWENMEQTATEKDITALFTQDSSDTLFNGFVPVDLSGGTLFRNAPERETTLVKRAQAFFRSGGITMYPLAGLLIWALLIIIERIVYYLHYRFGHRKTVHKTLSLLEESKSKELMLFLKKRKDHFAKLATISLQCTEKKSKEKEEHIREYLLQESPRLEARLGTLAVIAASAPLLGLFGTVTGMIEMFNAITRYGTGDPKLLASGISEALITTETGLAIAIPLLLIHNMLRNRKNRILADLDIFATQLVNRTHTEDKG